jgi:hypothetical protein
VIVLTDMRHATALPRPPSQAGSRATGPRLGGHDAGPLQLRSAWYGVSDRGRFYGGRPVLKRVVWGALVYSLV